MDFQSDWYDYSANTRDMYNRYASIDMRHLRKFKMYLLNFVFMCAVGGAFFGFATTLQNIIL